MFSDRLISNLRNKARIEQRQQYARFTKTQTSFTQKLLYRGGQLQQAHIVRDALARTSGPLANLILREPKNLAQLGKGMRLLQTVQVLPLQVLDNSHLRCLLVGDLAHDRRNRLFARELGRAAAPLAEDQNITS